MQQLWVCMCRMGNKQFRLLNEIEIARRMSISSYGGCLPWLCGTVEPLSFGQHGTRGCPQLRNMYIVYSAVPKIYHQNVADKATQV